MEEKVIIVHESNHGEIGVARNVERVVYFLCNSDWLDKNLIVQYIYDEDLDDYEEKSIEEDLGEDWRKKIEDMSIKEFNEYFEDIFYLEEEIVY
jgi:hypothetical protein